MPRIQFARLLGATITMAAALGLPPGAVADDLDAVLESERTAVQLAQASQGRIDEVVGETRNLEADYRRLLKEIDGLEVYTDYMERQIANQDAELLELRESIDRVSSVERQIMPLMVRMLEGLKRFVELDVPFLIDKRMERVANLEALLEQDVSVSEKFRRVTEAFQVENDFGRTIETYQDTLVIDGATLEVSVLRVGRVGLYYQTSDASVTGRWDRTARDWVKLTGSEDRNQVRQGLRIARKQVAPDLLLLPIETAGVPR
jgi:hypothetical protein